MPRPQATRKELGAWYTPGDLIDLVVAAVVERAGRRWAERDRVRIVDPACGDGRFVIALANRLAALGHAVELVGVDIDPGAIVAAEQACGASATGAGLSGGVSAGVSSRWVVADALTHQWVSERFDVVIGNPPFLSQMAQSTTRGGSSSRGGGPYADAAVEFVALASELVADDGLVGLVLPQSILGSRDAGPVRDRFADRCPVVWSWWAADQAHFDANVNVCAIVGDAGAPPDRRPWTTVVTDALGVPPIGPLATAGTIADRAELNANFRDEYYALVPAVSDEADGPPLVTSGLIDPGRCWWGTRPVRFAKQRFDAPRVDLSKLDGRFPAWASRKLVPKVLVANQTRIVEAVADPDGAWLPGVPVTTVTPNGSSLTNADLVWEIAAVLTSPVASAWCWHQAAGTGLSTRAVRVSPTAIGSVPWPAGDLSAAVAALQAGDVATCGTDVLTAYHSEQAENLMSWWLDLCGLFPQVDHRSSPL